MNNLYSGLNKDREYLHTKYFIEEAVSFYGCHLYEGFEIGRGKHISGDELVLLNSAQVRLSQISYAIKQNLALNNHS